MDQVQNFVLIESKIGPEVGEGRWSDIPKGN